MYFPTNKLEIKNNSVSATNAVTENKTEEPEASDKGVYETRRKH